jgi:hypothetical protein
VALPEPRQEEELIHLAVHPRRSCRRRRRRRRKEEVVVEGRRHGGRRLPVACMTEANAA